MGRTNYFLLKEIMVSDILYMNSNFFHIWDMNLSTFCTIYYYQQNIQLCIEANIHLILDIAQQYSWGSYYHFSKSKIDINDCIEYNFEKLDRWKIYLDKKLCINFERAKNYQNMWSMNQYLDQNTFNSSRDKLIN